MFQDYLTTGLNDTFSSKLKRIIDFQIFYLQFLLKGEKIQLLGENTRQGATQTAHLESVDFTTLKNKFLHLFGKKFTRGLKFRILHINEFCKGKCFFFNLDSFTERKRDFKEESTHSLK